MARTASCCDDAHGLGAAAGTTAREIEVVGSYPTRQIPRFRFSLSFQPFQPFQHPFKAGNSRGNTPRTWASNQ